MQKKQYDVIVIGAGPAGNIASRFLADKGYDVLQVEKRPVIGSPVRCGEATTHRKRLLDFGPISEDFIETDISGIIYHTYPDLSITARQENMGLMLDRIAFDQWYAEQAVKSGVEQHTSARVFNIEAPENGKRKVHVHYKDEDWVIEAPMVVGADGVEALTGRWTGLKNIQKPPQTCSAIELKVDVLDPNPDCLTFWHGHDYINDGYIWSFPKAKSGTTNFGAGFITPKLNAPNIHDITMEHLAKYLPEAKVTKVWGGAVPVSGMLQQEWADHFLLAGDSAHHTNPMTGGGIIAAMCAGQFAAEAIHEAFVARDFSESFLRDYRRRIDDWFGKRHVRDLKIRKFILGMDRKEQMEFYALLKTLVEEGKWPLFRKYPAALARNLWKWWRFK